MNHQEEVSKIAYDLFLKRNGESGDALQDWVAAEKIFEESNSRAARETISERKKAGADEKISPKISIRVKASPKATTSRKLKDSPNSTR